MGVSTGAAAAGADKDVLAANLSNELAVAAVDAMVTALRAEVAR